MFLKMILPGRGVAIQNVRTDPKDTGGTTSQGRHHPDYNDHDDGLSDLSTSGLTVGLMVHESCKPHRDHL